MSIRSAIILAAGRGSRIGAHTERAPKCLVRLGGRCLLDWQVDALHAAGVDDITLVAGYRADALRKRTNLRLVENPAWQSSGPVTSLCTANPASYSQGFFIVYGDGAFHPDLIRALKTIPESIGITSDSLWRELWSARFAQVLDDAETLRFANGRLLEIGARSRSPEAIQGQFTGLVKFDALGWARAQRCIDGLGERQVASLDMTTLLAQLLLEGAPIGVASIAGRWCEVDSASDLALYRRLLRRRRWAHDWRWETERVWA